MTTITAPIKLQTEVQPGKQRDPYLWQQISQLQAAINQLLVQTAVSVVRDYTAEINDAYVLVNTTNGNVIVTLPPAASFIHAVTVKKAEATGNTITVVAPQGQKVDGAASKVISVAWASLSFVSDGKDWYTV